MSALRRGGCQCGAVRYEVRGEPLATYVCHCRECRKQSASAFGISVIYPAASFNLTAGRAKFWSRRADSGRTLRCAFCAQCGTRLWHERDTISVKGGSLDEPPDLTGATHIWTRSKLAGVVVPSDATQFPEEPD